MPKLEMHDEGSKSKPSPDPWIVKTVEHILRPVQTPWISINAISSYLTEDQLKQRVLYGIESDIRYMQERLEIIKSAEFEKPGPDPWKLIEAIEKPDPIPWKLVDTILRDMPKDQLKQIAMRGLESEIKYIQEGIAIRKLIYDELRKKAE